MNMPHDPSSQLPPAGPTNAAFDPGGAEPFPEEWLSAYLDDELTDEERAIVDERVAQDPLVAQLLDELRRVRGLVGQLPAWSGRSLPVSTGGNGSFENDEVVDESIESASEVLGGSRLGESSDRLTRLGESRGNLTRLGESSDYGGSRRWTKLLGLAGSLLLAACGGLWWWYSDPPLTLATNLQVNDQQPAAETGAAKISEADAPIAASDASLDEQPASLTQSGSSMAHDRQMIEREEVNAPVAAAASPVPASQAPAGGTAARPKDMNFEQDALGTYAAPLGQPDSSPALDRRSAGNPSGGLQLGLNSSQTAPTVASRLSQQQQVPQVELARSAGWSDAEVQQALSRLAPYLQTSGEPPADMAIDPAVAAIPIGLLAQKSSGWSSAELLAAVQQPPLQLQAVAGITVAPTANDSVANDAAQVDRSLAELAAEATRAPRSAPPKPLALFVLRDEAERIVQAAQQGEQLLAAPVWITPSTAISQTARPNQQVVLLVTPQ